MNIFITVIIACFAFIFGFLLCAAFTASKADELPELPKYDEPISCRTCKHGYSTGALTDKCFECASKGKYTGYERGDKDAE